MWYLARAGLPPDDSGVSKFQVWVGKDTLSGKLFLTEDRSRAYIFTDPSVAEEHAASAVEQVRNCYKQLHATA